MSALGVVPDISCRGAGRVAHLLEEVDIVNRVSAASNSFA